MTKTVAKIFSAELEGIQAKLIEVETDINVGLHSFSIVGLADKAVSESKERINAALKNTGIKPPTKENRRITINLAPADIKKSGSQFDLAMAIGYLVASGQIKQFETRDKLFVGELSLDGALRSVNGSVSIAKVAKKHRFQYLFLPNANAAEAALIKGIKVMPVTNLKELIDHLEENTLITPQPATEFKAKESPTQLGLEDIKGQENAKRGLAIAAAGGHHMLMSGSPGAGKTMLAQGLISILPPPSLEEALEINQIYSATGILDGEFLSHRPFRSPHHGASLVAIIGGGPSPKPGEISLAHRGVLFLDELPEFRRDILEALRQPLEAGVIHVARSKSTVAFPAKFTLIAAMNPCPCGYFNDPDKECRCSGNEIFRYQKKISGPLLDRIDIQLEMPKVSIDELQQKTNAEEQARVGKLKEQIKLARQIQEKRFAKTKPRIFSNAEMSSKQAEDFSALDAKTEVFLKNLLEKSFISARGYYRILKAARTIADLEAGEKVSQNHLAEAFHYRIREDREFSI